MTPEARRDARVQDARELGGTPDAFRRFWVPYRMAYIGGQDKPADASAGECPFCAASRKPDAEGLVVHRGRACFVLMNLYPYNSGHVLVCPYRHVSDYTELSGPEREELALLTAQAIRAERQSAGAQGFNVGMNLGEVAGAGIAAHLHEHVVPRWAGDTNFLPIVARTKSIPELLEDARARLAAAWPADPREA